ncbi:TPA: hypothetical protein L6B33_14535 [Pseudomonas aeruginosa]|nr:hypothetical protein U769_01315 [Pseudomonas aeruginosa MTB-1]AZZ15200.1 hypothetical protein CEK59_27415 [Pseudomonas aeruginosa]ETD52943.1 hypothetical protein X922_07105 [Pseudomonas aeruginosa VRFPA08]KSH40040.1 hypothetical protein AO969_32900 [Pseudomonas aeruginosa]PBV49342.1 hypothetical protein CJU28_23715 [Pseudomonas aeruginosa]
MTITQVLKTTLEWRVYALLEEFWPMRLRGDRYRTLSSSHNCCFQPVQVLVRISSLRPMCWCDRPLMVSIFRAI